MQNLRPEHRKTFETLCMLCRNVQKMAAANIIAQVIYFQGIRPIKWGEKNTRAAFRFLHPSMTSYLYVRNVAYIRHLTVLERVKYNENH